jgi:hypothetical protein
MHIIPRTALAEGVAAVIVGPALAIAPAPVLGVTVTEFGIHISAQFFTRMTFAEKVAAVILQLAAA